jgi:hypothetical protein
MSLLTTGTVPLARVSHGVGNTCRSVPSESWLEAGARCLSGAPTWATRANAGRALACACSARRRGRLGAVAAMRRRPAAPLRRSLVVRALPSAGGSTFPIGRFVDEGTRAAFRRAEIGAPNCKPGLRTHLQRADVHVVQLAAQIIDPVTLLAREERTSSRWPKQHEPAAADRRGNPRPARQGPEYTPLFAAGQA